MKELKIGTSWVRGVVGSALTPELVADFASAFGTWCRASDDESTPVVLGRDSRRSSRLVRAASVAGLVAAGAEVIDLGVVPTPMLAFAVRDLGARGALSITGSHNDARWNALKFVGSDGALLNAVRTEELLDIYHASAFERVRSDRMRPVLIAPEGVAESYLEHLCSSLDTDLIRERRFRVAVDFSSGACGVITRRLLEGLGCDLIALNESPTGRFSRAPGPGIANMGDLVSVVRRQHADLGAILNVDGDRVAFVARGGIPLSEEHTLPIAAWGRWKRRGGTVVTSISTSRRIDRLAERHGGRVVRTTVGEGSVIDRAIEESAVLAGEGSGGVAALPGSLSYDGIHTLASTLETIALEGGGLDGLVDSLPRSVMRKGEVACAPDRVSRALEHFRDLYAREPLDTTDGVRVALGDGAAWLHVRGSSTEPLVRVIVEADDDSTASELFEASMRDAQRAISGGHA